ncbi:MAG TPA: PhoH family protein, partial [Candidatus Nanoarchaeia archaeon]|nr:PhoH family protein [Candidatus Nanoarchaeia archaeon]
LKERCGEGDQDTLNHLRSVSKRSPVVERGQQVTVFRISDNLDLASIDTDDDRRGVDYTSLEQRVRNMLATDQKPAIITSQPDLDFKLTSQGLRVEGPNFLMVGPDIINEGLIKGSTALQTALYQNGCQISLERAMDIFRDDLYMHQFIYFDGGDFARVVGDYVKNKSKTRIVDVANSHVAMLSGHEKGKQLKIGSAQFDHVLGVKPLDMEQYLALQFGLLNPDVEMMFLCGGAGSGKTVLSYVSAVAQVLHYNSAERKRRDWGERGGLYDRIVLLKPIEIVGGKRRDVGFLPGPLYDKIKQHLKSYEDAHKISALAKFPFEEMFLHPKYPNDFGKIRAGGEDRKVDGAWLSPKSEVIELTYSGFLRGRSFQDVIVIVDEAQNFTPYEMKTIIERLGPGCKIIITGDAYGQLDNPLCTKEINGLTHSVKEFLPYHYSCVVPLTRLYRSQAAEDAANWSGVYQ